MTVECVIKSLENSCLNVKRSKGIILHSDLRTQYTSQKFQELISKKEMIHSFNRKGNLMIMHVLSPSILFIKGRGL